jgi:hypothetical protein
VGGDADPLREDVERRDYRASRLPQAVDLPSWTFGGSPVPSLPPGIHPDYTRGEVEPLRPAVNYLYRLQQAPPGAAIPVENITVVPATL